MVMFQQTQRWRDTAGYRQIPTGHEFLKGPTHGGTTGIDWNPEGSGVVTPQEGANLVAGMIAQGYDPTAVRRFAREHGVKASDFQDPGTWLFWSPGLKSYIALTLSGGTLTLENSAIMLIAASAREILGGGHRRRRRAVPKYVDKTVRWIKKMERARTIAEKRLVPFVKSYKSRKK